MVSRLSPVLISFALCASQALACAPLRFGIPDQHRPPYWMGDGSAIANPPGASVELLRQFASSAGCPPVLKRMPVLRIVPALSSGQIDFAPMDIRAENDPGIVFPRDKDGHLDRARAISMVVVVFVRKGDALGRDLDTRKYFQHRQLGATLGSSYIKRLKQEGFEIDSGAIDVARNFDKLKLRRIDGFAVSLISAGDMDAYVRAHHGDAIMRLEQPLFADYVWIAASRDYYAQHPERVQAMWSWLDTSGKAQFSRLLKKYAHQQ